ncbi:right-handed parallel beta-helix repeat-containing protein [Candidatus Acetothermia bacterium]|nr:right-handed parallel beta-helix repeat-containing protein [Candidatus Acetothermia bacterium]
MRRSHTVLFVLIVLFVSLSSLVSAKTISVPADFSTIQAALNAAVDGDTIAVAAGSYFESLNIGKSVSIEGTGKDTTTIDGSAGRTRQIPTVLIKNTKNVTFKGFTVQGGRRGIQVEQATSVVIENNKILRNARQGVLVFTNSEATLRNNEITENIPDSNGFAGRGVNIVDSQVTLVGNTIANNSGYGVAIFSSTAPTKVQMENNKLTGNAYAGVFAFEEVQLQMNGDTIEASRAANDTPGNPALPGQGIAAQFFDYLVLNKVTLRNNAGDGIALSQSTLDLNETNLTANAGCGLKFDQSSQVNLGAKTVLETNAGGAVCGTLPSVAAGGKRSVTFNVSAAGDIKVFASSPSSATLALRLFAPGQSAPAAETSGPSPLSLTTSANGPTSGRWRVELENTSQAAVPVTLSVRQPLFNGSCDQILKDFSIAIVKEPGIRDFTAEECSIIYSVFRSLPLSWRGKVAQVLRRAQDPEVAGRAQSAFVQIFGDQTRNFLAHVAFHETAHVVHFKLFTPDQVSEWAQLHRAGGSDMENYIGVGTEDPNSLYGQTNEFEDFATVAEEYTADAPAVIALAKERAAKGKPVLLEKFKFLVRLLKDESGGPGVYIYRSVVRPMPDGSLRSVVQRAIALLDNEGAPVIPAEPEWEDF